MGYGREILGAVFCRPGKSPTVLTLHAIFHWLGPAGTQSPDKLFDADRFANVIIHPRSQAQLAITFHGIGGHGDDIGLPLL
jgi:hypothetical protein